MNWKVAYAIGFHPWEAAGKNENFIKQLRALLDREEDGREPPYGRALDVGTGSALWGVELAKRGWEVTGVDIVESALKRARKRAEAAGVAMRLVHGSVTTLQDCGVGADFRLVLDTGTFHSLKDGQHAAMGASVTAVTAPDAVMLLLAWPRRRRPLIRGVNRDGIEAAFPQWRITAVEPGAFKMPKPMEMILRPDEHWYRLERNSAEEVRN